MTTKRNVDTAAAGWNRAIPCRLLAAVADNVSAVTVALDGVDGGGVAAGVVAAVAADDSHDHPVMSSDLAASRSRTVPCKAPGKRIADDPV